MIKKAINGILLGFILVLISMVLNYKSDTVDIIKNNDYNYEVSKEQKGNIVYTTFINEDNRDNSSITNVKLSSAVNNYVRTKSILQTMGMENKFIDKLSIKKLNEYANCVNLHGQIVYNKISIDGDVTVVTEAEATQYAAPSPDYFFDKDDEGGGATSLPTYSNTFTDSYLKIYYLVAYLGDSEYKFSIDARWLKMPKNRKDDLIGATSMNMTVENNSRSGWYDYYIDDYIVGDLEDSSYHENNITQFVNRIDGNWYGSAAMFELPENLYVKGDIDNEYIVRDLRAHYEYKGKVIYPELVSNFNTTASYDHVTFRTLGITPKVSIKYKGVTATIGFDNEWLDSSDLRIVELPTSITYTL